MVDMQIADSVPLLTPRQDRIERALARVLLSGGTRSELRDVVYDFADLLRLQGVPPERAIAAVKGVAQKAMYAMPTSGIPSVGDSPTDRMAMIVRWCTARFYRGE